MNIERVIATAFLEELQKIASSDANESIKTAAATLHEEITIEEVESFLKEAGIGALVGGIGKGLGGLGMGALRGAGSMAAGLGRGVVGGARNAISSVGQGIKNSVTGAGSAIKAAPGALGERLTGMGQSIQQSLTGAGQRMQQAGAASGQAMQNRLSGGRNPQQAMKDIQTFQQANSPKPIAPTEPKPQVPMMGAGQLMGAYNPFSGMIGSAAAGLRGMVQPPPGQTPAPARTYGALAPAA